MRTRHSAPTVAQLRRRPRLPLWIGAIALLASACGHHTPVQTAVAPDAHVVRLRNFTVLQPQGVANASASADPVVRIPPRSIRSVSSCSAGLSGARLLRGYGGPGLCGRVLIGRAPAIRYVGIQIPVSFRTLYLVARLAGRIAGVAIPVAGHPHRRRDQPQDQGAPLARRSRGPAPLRSVRIRRGPPEPGRSAIAGKFQAGSDWPIAPPPLPHGGRPGQ